MTDTDTYIRRLEEANPLREPTLRMVVRDLHLPSGSRGLDVGCGIGLQAMPGYYAFFTYSMFRGKVPDQDTQGDKCANQDSRIPL
jgi:hypothetical protein